MADATLTGGMDMLKMIVDHPNVDAIMFYVIFLSTVWYLIRRMYKKTTKLTGGDL